MQHDVKILPTALTVLSDQLNVIIMSWVFNSAQNKRQTEPQLNNDKYLKISSSFLSMIHPVCQSLLSTNHKIRFHDLLFNLSSHFMLLYSVWLQLWSLSRSKAPCWCFSVTLFCSSVREVCCVLISHKIKSHRDDKHNFQPVLFTAIECFLFFIFF